MRVLQFVKSKQSKPNVAKVKIIEDAVGAISRNKYQVGDFVSMDQHVVKDPGRLPTGCGREAEHNMFHGGTTF